MSKNRRLNPPKIIAIGFAGIITLGTLLLLLPVSSADGKGIGLLNALFTSTSGVCVTGLSTIVIVEKLSLFGQIVLMLLIQAGGLGFMTLTVTVFILLGHKITLKDRLLMQEQYNQGDLQGLIKLTLKILYIAFSVEFIGAVLLSFSFIPTYGAAKGIFYSIFHAVTAFCNSGYDLIGPTSFSDYQGSIYVCLSLSFIIIIGGLGFPVILNIIKRNKGMHFSLNTKVVLLMTVCLLFGGTAFIFLNEFHNPLTVGKDNLTLAQKAVSAFFYSVNTRSAGFTPFDNNALHPSSKLFSALLMFIGSSPGSTGGGIKTTTMFILLRAITVTNLDNIVVFKRRLPAAIIGKASAVAVSAMGVLFTSTLLLSMFEQGNPETAQYQLIDHLYEVTSAFGTVGLSSGLTPYLTTGSKIVLIITMFIGRIGPLSLTLALTNKATEMKSQIKYSEEKIMIG